MLDQKISAILNSFKDHDWIPEPQAKEILKYAGLNVPKGILAQNVDQASEFIANNNFPLVAKIVSSEVVHKSDLGGVISEINSQTGLKQAFEHLKSLPGFEKVLIEETITGIELFLGAKKDEQFGPVILLGIGGTAVEVYNDVVLRMAPVQAQEVPDMLDKLKGKKLLQGFRGQEAINEQDLAQTVQKFSELVMDLENQIESIDLNPLICSAKGCIAADARIMKETTKHTK